MSRDSRLLLHKKWRKISRNREILNRHGTVPFPEGVSGYEDRIGGSAVDEYSHYSIFSIAICEQLLTVVKFVPTGFSIGCNEVVSILLGTREVRKTAVTGISAEMHADTRVDGAVEAHGRHRRGTTATGYGRAPAFSRPVPRLPWSRMEEAACERNEALETGESRACGEEVVGVGLVVSPRSPQAARRRRASYTQRMGILSQRRARLDGTAAPSHPAGAATPRGDRRPWPEGRPPPRAGDGSARRRRPPAQARGTPARRVGTGGGAWHPPRPRGQPAARFDTW